MFFTKTQIGSIALSILSDATLPCKLFDISDCYFSHGMCSFPQNSKAKYFFSFPIITLWVDVKISGMTS